MSMFRNDWDVILQTLEIALDDSLQPQDEQKKKKESLQVKILNDTLKKEEWFQKEKRKALYKLSQQLCDETIKQESGNVIKNKSVNRSDMF